MDADANPPPAEPPRQRRRMAPRAPIWEHYTRMDNDTSMCNYCGHVVGCNSTREGTSPMLSHNRRCQMFLDAMDGNRQTVIGTDSSGNMRAIRYCPETFRTSVMQMVVLNELPFSFVESAGFRLFCSNVVPLYQPFSRRTGCREFVRMFMSEKSALQKMFVKDKKRVSLTTDIWVAPTTSYNYMVVTAHWIDDEWRMQKRILSFKPIFDHKGETIADQLLQCLEEWGIEKVFTVTVDNARNNDRALAIFSERFTAKHGADALVQGGVYLHMRCCAHILNLVVRDGMAKVGDSILKVRNAVRYVRSSFSRLKSFELRTESGKVARGNLTLDCNTRWNSTYLMLRSALKFSGAFSRMEVEDKLFCEYFLEEEQGQKRVGPPSDGDWAEINGMVKFLKIFFKATLAFSASKTVTSTLCYNEIVTIERNLLKRCFCHDRLIREQAYLMREKFDKYWDGLLNMNPLIIITSVFDPRNKMIFATVCFEELYGCDSDDFSKIHSIVTNSMKMLFNEYNHKYGVGAAASVSEMPSMEKEVGGSGDGLQLSDDDDDEEYERMDSIYSKMQKEKTHQAIASELEMYLMEKPEIRVDLPLGLEYDVLGWWRLNAPKFPVLSELAKDVLAIQVSSVASESAFSTSGRILDPYRSSLTPFMVEALVCTQQWLRATAPDRSEVQNLVQMVEEVVFLESLDPGTQQK